MAQGGIVLGGGQEGIQAGAVLPAGPEPDQRSSVEKPPMGLRLSIGGYPAAGVQ